MIKLFFMDLSFHQIFMLVIFGFLVGILGSVMGIGGGTFIVPFLVIVLKIPIKYAIAVSLVSIIATSSAVASVNVERGLANVRLGIMLELTMAIGSIVSTYIMISLNSQILQILFAVMLLPVAASMYIKARKSDNQNTYLHSNNLPGEMYSYYDPSIKRNVSYIVLRSKKRLSFLLSFFGGCVSGLFGLGGGIIQVPVMNMLLGIPIKAATATSNFMIGLSACASALILWKKGYVLSDIAVFMIIGVLIGSIFGMNFLYKAKNSTIQTIFSILLMLVSLRMIVGVFK